MCPPPRDSPGSIDQPVGAGFNCHWSETKLPERMREQTRRVQMALFEREAAAFAAVDTLLASADEKVRLRASTWLLNHALKLGTDALPPKSLADLQLDELEREVAGDIAERRSLPKEAS